MSGGLVRVAVVDSGVDTAHAAFAGLTIRTFGIVAKGLGLAVEPCDSGDGSGHGTACAGIVHKVAPFAEIVSVRALGPDGRGSRDALIASLRFCVREGFEVVNLSLGVDMPKSAPPRPTDQKSLLDLYEVADEAFDVAAFEESGDFADEDGVGAEAFEDQAEFGEFFGARGEAVDRRAVEVDDFGDQEGLAFDAFLGDGALQAVEHQAFVGRVLVDDDEAVLGLRDDVGVVQLASCDAEREAVVAILVCGLFERARKRWRVDEDALLWFGGGVERGGFGEGAR